MNLDPRKSEYSPISHSPIKHEESDKISREIETFLAKGGKIRNLSNSIHANPDYGLFDKRMDELASLARINRRKTFNFQCSIHGVAKHRTSDMRCDKCVKQKLHDEKLKQITEKHCGVAI